MRAGGRRKKHEACMEGLERKQNKAGEINKGKVKNEKNGEKGERRMKEVEN